MKLRNQFFIIIIFILKKYLQSTKINTFTTYSWW